MSENEYDSDCLETFEDALESVGSTSTSETTDSDDTEKLTKDFEVLQLSSQDESEKSQDRESSSQSWQKCDEDELQDGSSSPSSEEFSKISEPRDSPEAHCSREEPIVSPNTPEKEQSDESAKSNDTSKAHQDEKPVEDAPPVRKTSAEWKIIVENYKSDRVMGEKLKEITQNLEKLRSKPTPEESDDEDLDQSDGLKIKNKKCKTIIDNVIEMMNHVTVSSTISTEEHGRLFRALKVTMYLKSLGSTHYTPEVLSIVLDLMGPDTKTQWLEDKATTEKPSYAEFIDFLYRRCQLVGNPNSQQTDQAYQTQCFCCKLTHKMFHCEFFRCRGVGIRWKMAKESHLCSNCLQGRHPVYCCFSMNYCKICYKRHNTILHKSAEMNRISRLNRRQRKREA